VAVSPQQMAEALREFARTGRITTEVRKTLRGPLPEVRAAIKKNAVTILPASGGFGKWVASNKITATVSSRAFTVTVRLRGSRSSLTGKRSDLRRIDAGTTRHPSWGRRGKGQWHTQVIPAKYFTDPASKADYWRPAIEKGVAVAIKSIGG
jgi:hypothetical protein